MEKEKSLFNYFFYGFTLMHKSFDIYLLAIILASLTLLRSLFPNILFSGILSILLFLLTIINLGFLLSVPVFFLYKQQNKSLNLQIIFSTTIQNTKRIILPGILIWILIILFITILVILLHPSQEQLTQFVQNWNQGWNQGRNPITLILQIISSFFIFTPFLFSIEHKGLLASIKDSVLFSFKHLTYLSLVIILEALSSLITGFFPAGEPWGLLIGILIGSYISLTITASTLFYYQRKIKIETNS